MKKIYWKDTIHGFIAESSCRTVAWAIIRKKCKELNLIMPSINNVVEIDKKEINLNIIKNL